jgi:hypothetical protein
MYINGKMRPMETIQGIGQGRIDDNRWGGEFKYDISNILKEFLEMPWCTPTQHNKN